MLPSPLPAESYERFMGIYWGAVSWPYVCENVESADVVVSVGAIWTDYTSVSEWRGKEGGW